MAESLLAKNPNLWLSSILAKNPNLWPRTYFLKIPIYDCELFMAELPATQTQNGLFTSMILCQT
jgi:hypothetical protein